MAKYSATNILPIFDNRINLKLLLIDLLLLMLLVRHYTFFSWGLVIRSTSQSEMIDQALVVFRSYGALIATVVLKTITLNSHKRIKTVH